MQTSLKQRTKSDFPRFCLTGCKGIQLCQVAPDCWRHVCSFYTSLHADTTCHFPFLVSVWDDRTRDVAWLWSWCNVSHHNICAHIFSRLIHCTWVYPLERFPPFFGYYFFNVMLVVLEMLHLYWAVLISRMVYKFIFTKVCLQMFWMCIFIHVFSIYAKSTKWLVSPPPPPPPAAGGRRQEWRRGGWQWLTEGQKPQIESHQWRWSQRPSQWSLTRTDRQRKRKIDSRHMDRFSHSC